MRQIDNFDTWRAPKLRNPWPYPAPDSEYDITTDEAKCLWCGSRLKKTTRGIEIVAVPCTKPTCLAMLELKR